MREEFPCDKAIEDFGLNPGDIAHAALRNDILGYVEFHIEQGPVLETLKRPLGVVEAIAGQSRLEFTFLGRANHAGTTPMHLRYDAIAGAAEWITAVEREAHTYSGSSSHGGHDRGQARSDQRHCRGGSADSRHTSRVGRDSNPAQWTISFDRRKKLPNGAGCR